MRIERLDPANPPELDAGMIVHESPVGAHVAILYCANDKGERHIVHQRWHYQSGSDELGKYTSSRTRAIWWVEPTLDEDELANLAAHARLAAERLKDGSLPFAFGLANATMKQGLVSLNDCLGLTCATFVVLVFQSARVGLLDHGTWKSRPEDATALKIVLEALKKGDKEAQAQATRLEQDAQKQNPLRIRAEEVAAASSVPTRPANYATVEPLGKQILSRIKRG